MDHIEQVAVPSSKIWLKVSGNTHDYFLHYSTDGQTWKKLGEQKACYLSSETNWGFTGIMIGIWAYSPSDDGKAAASDFHADFEEFRYCLE